MHDQKSDKGPKMQIIMTKHQIDGLSHCFHDFLQNLIVHRPISFLGVKYITSTIISN